MDCLSFTNWLIKFATHFGDAYVTKAFLANIFYLGQQPDRNECSGSLKKLGIIRSLYR